MIIPESASGLYTFTPGIFFKPSIALFLNFASYSLILSNPIDSTYWIARANPIAPAIFCVPASNFKGGIWSETFPHVSNLVFIPPPERRGEIFFKSSYFPYITPIPVGPQILCPEKAKKSQSISLTSTFICGTLWAPSTINKALCSWAIFASSLTSTVYPKTFVTWAKDITLVFGVIEFFKFSAVIRPSSVSGI